MNIFPAILKIPKREGKEKTIWAIKKELNWRKNRETLKEGNKNWANLNPIRTRNSSKTRPIKPWQEKQTYLNPIGRSQFTKGINWMIPLYISWTSYIKQEVRDKFNKIMPWKWKGKKKKNTGVDFQENDRQTINQSE